MESASVIVAPKENGSSELQEKDDIVSMNDGLAVDEGECESVSINLLQPLHTPEDEEVDGLHEVKDDEPPCLDEYASDEVIAESIVVASVNGDQVTLVHDEISADGGIISTEMAEISALGNPEPSGVDILDSLRQPDVLGDTVAVSDSHTTDEHLVENTADAPEKDADEPVEPGSTDLEPGSEGEVGKGDAGRTVSQRKDGGGGESGGKDSPKGRFAIQAELNINSRPRRSVPRRSVFEMLQGEIRSPGHSKRSSMDTGSESDREPGPSRPANSRRSRLSASERSEGLDDGSKKGREERSQVARQGLQTKRKNLERDEKALIKDSHQPYKKKYVQSSLGANASTDEQEAASFAADEFNLIGTEDRIAQDSDITTNLEDEEDNLALASFRKENLQHSSDCEPSDNPNILCDESVTGDVGVDSESNFEDLEHANRWHSCSSPGALESPPNVLESPADQDDSRHSQVMAATSIGKDDKGRANSQTYGDALESDTSVAEDKKRSGTPWYLVNRAGYEASSDPKTLKYRIDELLKANTELRTRLKEVESRTATKKFNIDFHSRKFSKARQPVFGSPADRKSAASLGKTGAGVGAEWGTGGGGGIFDKDVREKELALDRKEDKLRALDVELDERASQLKASEGRLLRSERRLKEMEKTLEHRERVLKRMETNAERTESEGKDDDDVVVVPSNPEEQLPSQASGSAAEADGTKLERKEHELERLRRFLSEEREKMLPKQQRLTKWEMVLRKKEYELRLREQRLVSTSASKKHRLFRSEEESDSDEVSQPLKTFTAKSHVSVHKRNLVMKKRKEMLSSKAFKGTAKKAFSMNKIKTVASNRTRPHLTALVGKKQSADGKPLKEYKLRRRC